MAFLVQRKNGSWEIRESRQTKDGPRSRTLATFRVPSREVMDRAIERSEQGLLEGELRLRMRAAGIPYPTRDVDQAARALLAEIGKKRLPKPALWRLLLAVVNEVENQSQDAVPDWIFRSHQQKGEDLWDLLLLADRLPIPDPNRRPRFPNLKKMVNERTVTAG